MEIISEEEYLAQNGYGRQMIGEPALSKKGRNQSAKTWSKICDHQLERDVEITDKRAELRKEYHQKVNNGEIRPPTVFEQLIKTASGHDDNEAVKAARRILTKQGINW